MTSYIITLKTQATPFVVENVTSARGEPSHIQLLDSEGSTLFSIPVADLVDFKRVQELPKKVRKQNVNLSADQRKELERLREAGHTHAQLAKMFGVSTSSVFAHFQRKRKTR
jgi:DNA-directed RNA polymerase specialized sigma24 family protein